MEQRKDSKLLAIKRPVDGVEKVMPKIQPGPVIITAFDSETTVTKLSSIYGWVGWLSGKTSVSDRRTFTGLHRTCSRWVTIYMGKPSAVGQPTRPTQPFILTGSISE